MNSFSGGITLMISATFGFGLMALAVKATSGSVSPMDLVFWRSIVGMLLVLILGRRLDRRFTLTSRHPWILILRSLSGFGALAAYFYAISRMPLGAAVILAHTSPVFTVIVAGFALKEKAAPVAWFCIGTAFAGVLLVSFPEPGGHAPLAALIAAVASGFFSSIAYVCIRSVKEKESPFTVIFYFTAISALLAGFWNGQLPAAPSSSSWPAVLLVSLGAFWGQVAMTRAIQISPVWRVLPFIYFTPVWSFAGSALFFGEKLTPLKIAGGVLIILAGSLLYRTGRKPSAALAGSGVE